MYDAERIPRSTKNDPNGYATKFVIDFVELLAGMMKMYGGNLLAYCVTVKHDPDPIGYWQYLQRDVAQFALVKQLLMPNVEFIPYPLGAHEVLR